jgi:hypothetical protein
VHIGDGRDALQEVLGRREASPRQPVFQDKTEGLSVGESLGGDKE